MVEVGSYRSSGEGRFTITLNEIDAEVTVNVPLFQVFAVQDLRFYKVFLEAGKTYHFLGALLKA